MEATARRRPFVVAVDGPSGAGKSTVARALARRLRADYLDTGAMYRALTWAALDRKVELGDERRLAELADQVRIETSSDPSRPSTWVDGRDVTSVIRSPRVTAAVSGVSAYPAVRTRLVARQQALVAGASGGIVVEGRDIGTVVVPDASVKVFLTASAAERATRRSRDLGVHGQDRVAGVRADLVRRDELDRVQSRPAPDAVRLDTTGLSVAAVVGEIMARCAAAGLPVPA